MAHDAEPVHHNSDIVQIEIRLIDRNLIILREFLPLEALLSVEQMTWVFWLAVGYMKAKIQIVSDGRVSDG
jgi:hypothetical protein